MLKFGTKPQEVTVNAAPLKAGLKLGPGILFGSLRVIAEFPLWR